MPAGSGELRLLTVNVNGLNSLPRVAALLTALTGVARHPHIVCVQEVKLADASSLVELLASGRGPGMPYHAYQFCSLGDDRSRGVCILVRRNAGASDLPEAASAADDDGRVVRVDFTVLGHRLSVISVYAPNAGRGAFFQSLHDYIPHDRICLIGGDFNCILDPSDQSNASQARFAGAATLRTVMTAHGLVDAYPLKHPGKPAYTHLAANSSARLDRWLISSAAAPWLTSARHEWCMPGDHAGVLISLSLPGAPTLGPGLRYFPTHVLFNEPLRHELLRRLDTFLATYAPPPGCTHPAYETWQQIKARLFDDATNISFLHASAVKRRLCMASAAAEMAGVLHAADPASPAKRASMAEAARAARAALELQAGRVAHAAHAMHADYGERCTAYQFAQVGPPHRGDPIACLRDDAGRHVDMATVKHGGDVTPIVTAHFSSDSPTGLYRVPNVDPAAQASMLAYLRALPAHLADDAEGPNGDGSLTVACMAQAVKEADNGKAPGPDGVPYEVYKALWPRLAEPLVAAVNEVFEKGAPTSEWGHGIIVPVFKGKGLPKDRLASYRPITLLNCDLRLVGSVVAARLHVPLDCVVSPQQTAFIRGRWIGDNVLNRQCLAEYLEASDTPGCFIHLDIKQAYDRCDRGWVDKVAQRMGFGAGMRRLIKVLSEGSTASLLVNGHHTHPFPVNNGLPQGGPAAPPLWAMQLQALTGAYEAAQARGDLRAPLLPGGAQAPPVGHHADDTGLHLRDVVTDGPVAQAISAEFCRASGALIHEDKSVGVSLGSHPPVHGREPVTGAVFPGPGEPPPKCLGVPCTTDMQVAQQMVYDRRVQGVHMRVAVWRPYHMSQKGRALVAHQSMANTLCYHVSFVPPRAEDVTALQAALDQFCVVSPHPEDLTLPAGNGRHVLPARPIARLHRDLGGLSHPDLQAQAVSLQAKVLAMCFSPGAAVWKGLTHHALASVAPHPAWGVLWVFAGIRLSDCQPGLSVRNAALVAAFRGAGLRPIPTAPDGSPHPARALLLAPLYHTSLLTDARGEAFAPPPDPPQDWPFTLGQLATCPAVYLTHPILVDVVCALPPAWRAALDKARAGPAALADDDLWQVAYAADGRTIVRPHPRLDAAARAAVVDGAWFEASPTSGLLRKLPATPDGLGGWEAACVMSAPVRRQDWTPEERDAYDALDPADRASFRPMRPHLLDAWCRVRAYPGMWGHAGLPLHHYACSTVRPALVGQLAASAVSSFMPDYVPGKAVRPPLWEVPGAMPGTSGLVALERLWAEQVTRKRAHALDVPRLTYVGQDAVNVVQPWMLPRAWPPVVAGPGPVHAAAAAAAAAALAAADGPQAAADLDGDPFLPPPPPLDAAPAGALTLAAPPPAPPPDTGPLAAAGPPPQAADAYASSHEQHWRRLWRLPVNNHVRTFACRLLHAALPCGAMYVARRGGDVNYAYCPCCCPAQARSPATLLTYSHLFVRCPTMAPAVTWLQDLWQHLAGVRPPADVLVLVADQPGAWAEAPAPSSREGRLWSVLRLTLLYCIWSAFASKDQQARSAAAVVRAAIETIRSEISVAYGRHTFERYLVNAAPPRVASMRRSPPANNFFVDFWVASGLCIVIDADPGAIVAAQAAQDGRRPRPKLVIRLSDAEPVQAPPFPP